ncbi:hypothetical protein [Kribbella sindirgiensis]|uniref:Uncharacterized protein n=1 Tax=Kribbella sindirgiensis TaxID=1124744 RepID=A0A4R0J195_9ACTN|nr:hypothetical protein [Kribbella sindirgiensis]TCC34905.1 hypothetical protein E0H50_13510 [Kribbella sindirgiensis]
MSLGREINQAIITFEYGAVLALVEPDGYPVAVRCRPEPVNDGQALRIRRPAWLRFDSGPACLMAHSHDKHGWKLRGLIAKGTTTSDGMGIVFMPAQFRWIMRNRGNPVGLMRTALRSLAKSREDAEGYLRRTGQNPPPIPWRTIIAAKKRARST